MVKFIRSFLRQLYTWFRKKLISITNTSHRDKSNTIYSAAEFVVFNQIEGDYL